MIAELSSWMDPIINYLLIGTTPKDGGVAQKHEFRVTRHAIFQGTLYCKSYLSPQLKYIAS